MEEEHRLHQTACNWDYGEPDLTGLSDEDAASVTLF